MKIINMNFFRTTDLTDPHLIPPLYDVSHSPAWFAHQSADLAPLHACQAACLQLRERLP